MKAVQINAYGGNEVVELNNRASEPQLAADHILVQVYAAGVNPSDWKIRQGLFQAWRPLTFPATLGGDFSGMVTAVAPGVTNFKVDDEVYGRALTGPDGSGSFAQFLSVAVVNTALKPKRLSHLEASAVPLAGVSAWQALIDHIGLGKGPAFAKASAGKQKVLIHGGAGGIGAFAIQLAKHLGAYVATTVGAKGVRFAHELGADEVIDYQKQAFETLVRGYDAVFDTVGGPVYEKSLHVLRAGGVIVSMTHPGDGATARPDIRTVAQQTEVTSERLAKLAELLDGGVLKVHIDKTFPLVQAKEALAYMETGRPRGKVVLEVWGNSS